MFYLSDLPEQGTSDGSAPDLRIYSNYQSGDIFSIGATPVTYKIQGLGIQCHFQVIVEGEGRCSEPDCDTTLAEIMVTTT